MPWEQDQNCHISCITDFCNLPFVCDPVATEEVLPSSLQHHGPVHSLGSEDQEDRK